MKEPPQSVSIGGTRLDFVGLARATKDALYTGVSSKGETVHAVVVNQFAAECQAAQQNRGS